MDLFLGFILVLIAIAVSYFGYMLPFMGVVFLALSILKLIDIKGFAKIFKTYDYFGQYIPYYAIAYPFIELFLAACFLFQVILPIACIITIIIMGVGSLGIIRNLMKKDKLSCACLGAKIQVPLTRFTLIEDLLMVVMAIVILAR